MPLSGYERFCGPDVPDAEGMSNPAPGSNSKSRRVTLKNKFQRHLDDSRIPCAGNLAKRAICDGCVRVVELGVIEEIEELRSVLKFVSLTEREDLMSGKIDVEGSRPDQNISFS